MMPFEGGVESPANATLIFSCAAALLYGTMLSAQPRLLRSIIKTLAVGLLAVLAFMQGGPWLLVLALALSAAGDFYLSYNGDRSFVAGLTRFLLAHLAFTALFLTIGPGYGVYAAAPVRALAAAIVIACGLGMLFKLTRRVGPSFKLPITAYVLAILAMVTSALTLDVPTVIVGALLFMISDALLSTEMFLLPAISKHREWMRYAIWDFIMSASCSSRSD